MKIRQAEMDDLEEIMSFYDVMCQVLGEKDFLPDVDKGGFPSHSGLSVGEDGGSHQSIEDIALMREMPHMTIFVPCDPAETEKAVMAAAEINGPVYIRVARPVCDDITTADTP